MLTTNSILENLGQRRFESYKSLLSNVASFWETHADRLPIEIGPRDVVAKGVSLRIIKTEADGSIIIVFPKRVKKNNSGFQGKRA